MGRTINGVPVSEVFKRLSGDIPGVVRYSEKGEPYLNVNTMRSFFDQHVPPKNYDFVCTEPKLHTIGERACFTCVGTLTVYDDEGCRIVSKACIGSNNCIIQKESGAAKDLAMDAKNAAVDAKKGCMRSLGCGEAQIEAAKAKAKADAKAGFNGGYSGSTSGQQTQFSANPKANVFNGGGAKMPAVGTVETFRIVCRNSNGARDGGSMYTFPVICLDYGNYQTKLLLWKNKVKDPKDIGNLICAGGELLVRGRFEMRGNEYRIVFERLES